MSRNWRIYSLSDSMACVRCDFYVPKDSVQGQWLETRDGLLKMLQEIPLSDEERAAVDGDVQALNRLLERLKDVPAPSENYLEKDALQVFIPVRNVMPLHRRTSAGTKNLKP